jgi:hypothetical protein
MKKYWLYTDEYPEDYQGTIPNDEWGICEFKRGDETEGEMTAIATKVIAKGTHEYLDRGFEMDLWDDAITDDPHRILKFLFERRFK